MSSARALPLHFFQRTAPEVARDLIGAVLVSRVGGLLVSGRISEVEAYLGQGDPASHAWRGRRHAQNEGLYRPAGWWYVYRSYGIHWCANLVTGPRGIGAAVLLRGVLPLEGLETMRLRRGGVLDRRLGDGPGKLTQAFGISRALDQTPMRDSPVVVLADDRGPDHEIVVGRRIGISRARDWPLRFLWNP